MAPATVGGGRDLLADSMMQYLLWPGLTLVVLVLWGAAVLDIERHRRAGRTPRSRLALMALCVSVVAVAAGVSAGAVVAPGWAEAVSRAEEAAGEPYSTEGDSPPAAIFSFGLERGFHAPSRTEGEERRQESQSRGLRARPP